MGGGRTIAKDAETPRASLRTRQGNAIPLQDAIKTSAKLLLHNVVLSQFHSRHSFMTLLFLSRECSRAKASCGIPE